MKRILIVDDEPDILSVLSWVLYPKYAVVTEKDSRKVVSLIEKGDFDLLIADLRMPNVGGSELIQIIHKIKPNLPIMAMSVYLHEAERIKSLNGEISGFLQKPFPHEELEEMGEKILKDSGNGPNRAGSGSSSR